MNVLFGLDDGFARPGAVAIASVDRHLTDSDRIWVFHLAMSDHHRRRIDHVVVNASLEFVDCGSLIEPSWTPPGHLTSATYLRFLAADLLSDVGRCLYLDGDVVVRRDPSELFDLDMSQHTLAAVRSRVAPFVASPGGVVHWSEAGIPSTAASFNAGVLVMNLDRWRDLDATAKLTDYLRRFGTEMLLADQEAMNAVLHDEWIQLDRTWNYITHVTESFLPQPELEPTDPHIVHFAGRSKPWSYDRKPIFSEDWYELLDLTPWAGWRPEPPEPPTRLAAVSQTVLRVTAARLRRLMGDT